MVAVSIAAQARSDAAIIARPGSGHPGLLRAGDDDVDAPGVHLERHRAQRRDAVDEDERLGRDLAHDRGKARGSGS
jgi:hypothetical protein